MLHIRTWLCCALLAVASDLPTWAQAARFLPFQGRLADASGTPLPNGVTLVQFQIFGDATGGTPLWAGEVHRVTVNGGLVNVQLGTKNPLPVDRPDDPSRSFFDSTLYLQITVDTDGNGVINAEDPPMLPRQAIVPVVYATESGNSRRLAGYDWAALFGTNDPTGPIPGGRVLARSINREQLAPGSLTTNELAQAVVDLLVPPGTIVAFGGEAGKVPPGWLLCDGNNYVRADPRWRRLFDAIGTAWGAPNANEFLVPDLRGVFLRGMDFSPATLSGNRDPDRGARTALHGGGNVGNAVGSYQEDAFLHHNHEILPKLSGYDFGTGNLLQGTVHSPAQYGQATTGETGGAETRPKNAYVNYIIKY